MAAIEEDFRLGHRARLKEKFLDAEDGSMPDYEVLELLLMYAIPRKDVKPLAKALLNKFGSLGNVLNASFEELQSVDGIKKNTALFFHAIAYANRSILKREVVHKTIFSSLEAVENYVYALLARKKKEYVYLILLDTQNRILDTVQLQKGTVSEAAVYVREVVEVLINSQAVSFILVHNHPSGSTKPSQEDILLTNLLYETTERLNIKMQDHFIVAPKGVGSFKLMGLMR